MFTKTFQRKYALSDQGVRNAKLGTFWTVIVNLVVMGGMGILYMLMGRYMDTLVSGAPLPGALAFILLTLAFAALSFLTHMQQYAHLSIQDRRYVPIRLLRGKERARGFPNLSSLPVHDGQ